MKKIRLKIGRKVYAVGENDLILDNGAIIQITTILIRDGWSSYSLKMSKKLFKDLKTCAFIFKDEKLTRDANLQYDKPFLTYYRFDIDKMIKNGYEVVEV